MLFTGSIFSRVIRPLPPTWVWVKKEKKNNKGRHKHVQSVLKIELQSIKMFTFDIFYIKNLGKIIFVFFFIFLPTFDKGRRIRQ